MKQDVKRALVAFDELMQSLGDLDLNHISWIVMDLKEQMVEELDLDDNEVEEIANSNINPFNC